MEVETRIGVNATRMHRDEATVFIETLIVEMVSGVRNFDTVRELGFFFVWSLRILHSRWNSLESWF